MSDFGALERDVAERLATAGIPGFAAAIVRDRHVCHAWGWGSTSVEDGALPVTPATLFCIGSATKPLTGAAIMRLVERARLDLDRPVTDYVPWLDFGQREMALGVTLRRLLSHTSGLPTTTIEHGPRDPGTLEAFIRREIAGAAFVAPPGKLFSYSNTGLILAGYILEVCTGRPFPEAMEELLFDPLGMGRTTFDRAVAMTYPLAQPHERDDAGRLRVRHRMADNGAGNPAGLAISTVLDLAQFVVMQLGREHEQVASPLSPISVAEMHRRHVSLHNPARLGYGLTWFVTSFKGRRLVMHPGSVQSYVCELSCFPDDGIGIVTLRNFAGDLRHWAIATLIYDRLLDLPAATPVPRLVAPQRSRWRQHEGTYLSASAGLATIAIGEGGLVLRLGAQQVALRAIGEDLYISPRSGHCIGFVSEPGGPTEYIVVNEVTHRRIDWDPSFTPAPDTMASFPGVYRFEDGREIVVSIEGGRLLLELRWAGVLVEAVPLSQVKFASARGLVEFQMGDGAPDALCYQAASVARRATEAATPGTRWQ